MERRFSFSILFIEAVVVFMCAHEIYGNPPGWHQYGYRRYPVYDYDNAYYRQGAPWIRESNPSKRHPGSYPHPRIGGEDSIDGPVNRASKRDDTIHFPDQNLFPRVFIPNPINKVTVCQGSTFCEEVSDYPEDLINQAIRANESLKHYASVDELLAVSQRINTNDDTPLCLGTEQVVYPKSAENANKTWMFVINQPNFVQGVRIETCAQESNPCNLIDGFAQGYVTQCEQKYIYRKLVAVMPTDGRVASDLFKFPASCCCHVKFIGNSPP